MIISSNVNETFNTSESILDNMAIRFLISKLKFAINRPLSSCIHEELEYFKIIR